MGNARPHQFSEMGELRASLLVSGHENWDNRCVAQLIFAPQKKKKKKKLEVDNYLLIIYQWGGLYGERISAFPTSVNLSFSYIQFGYFLSYLLSRSIPSFWISLRWELMHVQMVTHSVHGWKVGGF